MSQSPCSNCGTREERTTSVTIRLYAKRRQTDYRYHLCANDLTIIETLLSGPADTVQRSFFDHRYWSGKETPLE